MKPPRTHRPIWFALVAMLAVALLPTLSHALAHTRGGAPAGAAVCTAQGLRSGVAAPDPADATAPPATARLEHCPLCTLATDHPVLPPASASAGVRLSPATLALAPVAPALRGVSSWRAAQPRGPPDAT